MNELILNIEKLHTTAMGEERIRRNLSLGDADVVAYCAERICDSNCKITRSSKNFYAEYGSCIITVNAYSYTIITAHTKKG